MPSWLPDYFNSMKQFWRLLLVLTCVCLASRENDGNDTRHRGSAGTAPVINVTITLHSGGTGSALLKDQRLQAQLNGRHKQDETRRGLALRKTFVYSSELATVLQRVRRDEDDYTDEEENDKTVRTKLWSDDAWCDGMSSGARVQGLLHDASATVTAQRARRKVMKEFPLKFRTWSKYSSCDGQPCEDLVDELVSMASKQFMTMTIDAARQQVMLKYPEKFPVGGMACAFVVDGGSSGGRLYKFTEEDFDPEAIERALVCPNGHGKTSDRELIAFAGTKGDKMKVEDVIYLLMKGDLEPRIALEQVGDGSIPQEFVISHPLVRNGTAGQLLECYLYTLAEAVRDNLGGCKRSSLYFGVTAGYRDFESDVGKMGPEKSAALKRARKRFGEGMRLALLQIRNRRDALHVPLVKVFGGITILSISEEASWEAIAVRDAKDAVGEPSITKAQGVFSMGGKSAQFSEFGSHHRTLLFSLGHITGFEFLKDLGILTDNAEVGVDFEREAKIPNVDMMVQGFNEECQKKLGEALTHPNSPKKEDLGIENDGENAWADGLWIGIEGAAWAATYLTNLDVGEEGHGTVTRKALKTEIDKYLKTKIFKPKRQTQDGGDDRRELSQLLILSFWLDAIFTDKAEFYFRNKWSTKSDRPVSPTWSAAIARRNEPLIQQALIEEGETDVT